MLDLHALINLVYVIMFTTLGLFKQISCPEQPDCSLPNCVFAHHVSSPCSAPKAAPLTSPDACSGAEDEGDAPSLSRKKRKLNGVDNLTLENGEYNGGSDVFESIPTKLPKTGSRPISPPPLRRSSKAEVSISSKGQQATTQEAKREPLAKTIKPAKVSLNPRMLSSPPASHGVRMQFLKLLHDDMSLLNEAICRSDDPSKDAIAFSEDELILHALTEEEAAAKANPVVYSNVIKLRIMKLKKMDITEWKAERLKQIAKDAHPKSTENGHLTIPNSILTGLKPEQEVAFLPRLLAKQTGLAKFGYVEKPFTEGEIEQARRGLDIAKGWEQCDRCKSRFQVYPGRREEDGALTSGGHCRYHPAKPRRSLQRDNPDKSSREPTYGCCNENVGLSGGCTTAPSHVFKVSDPKRLAWIMPFEETPANPRLAGKHTAVCFDCEMGYTTLGLELIRLTATSWPSGDDLLDILVRPIGEILDLNSQFSGVWPKDFAAAAPYGAKIPEKSSTDKEEGEVLSVPLNVVDSPSAARSLLFSHLTPSTPLIGHALDNDLNSARIIHPTIVDTVLLYPHPRGLPIRFGLKVLMKKHLDRDIQMGGAEGHDSKEDARAAGELVRLKVAEMWKKMKGEGWTVDGIDFQAPMTKAEAMRAQIAKARKASLST